MIPTLNRDQLGPEDKLQLRTTTPTPTILCLSWDELSTKIRQVLNQEKQHSSRTMVPTTESIKCNFELCHRCNSMIKRNQLRAIMLPEKTAQTSFHQLPYTMSHGCTDAVWEGRTDEHQTPFGGNLRSDCLNQQQDGAYRLPW